VPKAWILTDLVAARHESAPLRLVTLPAKKETVQAAQKEKVGWIAWIALLFSLLFAGWVIYMWVIRYKELGL
jgi:hypothetical protein